MKVERVKQQRIRRIIDYPRIANNTDCHRC